MNDKAPQELNPDALSKALRALIINTVKSHKKSLTDVSDSFSARMLMAITYLPNDNFTFSQYAALFALSDFVLFRSGHKLVVFGQQPIRQAFRKVGIEYRNEDVLTEKMLSVMQSDEKTNLLVKHWMKLYGEPSNPNDFGSSLSPYTIQH